jgi:hypothetical protein
MVFGLEATGVQATSLEKVPGQQFFLLLLKDFGGPLVGGVDVPAHLPVGQLPALVGGVLADFVELGALQQELHHLGDLLLLQGFVGLGHGSPQAAGRRSAFWPE